MLVYRRKKLEKALRRVFKRNQKSLERAMRRADRPKRRQRGEIEKRIAKALRRRLEKIIKGYRRKTEDLIGCSVFQLRAHLESQFQSGMSWKNYGAWHIDHVWPCISFDLRVSENQLRCFNWSNLQPLWAKDNLSKNAKY